MLNITFTDAKFKSFIKKNIFLLLCIFIIIALVNTILYYNITYYMSKNSEDKLIENMEMLKLILEEKKTQISGYAIAVARYRGLFDINDDNLLKRRIFDLYNQLGISDIEIYNNKSDLVFKTGSSFGLIEEEKLSDPIMSIVEDGYTISFLSENDLFELQINAVSPIYDEYSIETSGFVIISDTMIKEDFQTIGNNIDGIVKFFKIEEIKQNKEKLLTDVRYSSGKNYYIKREKVSNIFYLVGYLPVQDFYNNTIGYITIFNPIHNISHLLYKLILISLIYMIIIIYLVSKIKSIKGIK